MASVLVIVAGVVVASEWLSGRTWELPQVVTPGEDNGPPSDAIVLFDGKDLSAWKDAEWIIQDGAMLPKSGQLSTRQAFGSCQLHIEWATPAEVKGEGQGRGNSGIKLMGQYEVQILDSYENETYPDGQAGAIYKQSPPLVNACRPPGEWQTMDIVFHAPQFSESGSLTKPATITVIQNGVLIQDHFELEGKTAWDKKPAYHLHGDKEPIILQDHGNPVRFRNIWIRELTPRA